MSENKHVDFPEFELVGEKCKISECNGVYIDTMNIKTKRWYRVCSICENKTTLISLIDEKK